MSEAELNATIIDPGTGEAELRAANVNPATGLATDFLNLFNEYIMLAELVADGSMDHDVLKDWLPIDYETHFSRSGFAGAEVVLNAYRNLEKKFRSRFENAVGELISCILIHQENPDSKPNLMERIMKQRDVVAAMTSRPVSTDTETSPNTQAAIDALFEQVAD